MRRTVVRGHGAVSRPTSLPERLEKRWLFSGPSAVIDAPTVTPGADNLIVVAHLTDSTPLLTSDISPTNLTMTGPSGRLTVTKVQYQAVNNDTQIDVTYFVAAPNGVWDQRANGAYQVSIGGDQLADANGALVPATATGLTVALTPVSAPLAAASQPSTIYITTPGATGAEFDVTYSDPTGIDTTTINGSNFDYFSSSLVGRVLSVTPQDSGKVVHVAYYLSAPHGAFFPTDSTLYHIIVSHTPANEVKNLAGVPVSANGLLGVFNVSIAPSSPSHPFAAANGAGFIAEASTTLSNGQKIVVGHIGDTTTGASRIQIERLNSDGSLDTTFGQSGAVLGPLGSNQDALAVTTSGNQLLLAGVSSGRFLLERLNADGSVDSSFGAGGQATAVVNPTASIEIADALIVGGDGVITIAGQSDGAWAIARFSSTGQSLKSFTVSLPDGLAGAVGGLAPWNGDLVIAGSDGNAVDVARVSTTGVADPGFNNGGLISLPQLATRPTLGYVDHSVGLAVDSTGRILVASRTPASPGQFATERLAVDGAPDTSFGSSGNGIVTTKFSGDADANSILLQSNATILVSGTNVDSSGTHTVSATYNADGSVYIPPPVVSPPLPPPVTPTPPASTYSISGQVQTVQGAPLAGRVIFIDANGSQSPSGQLQTSTDATGAFTLSGLAAGNYLLREVVPSGWQQVSPSTTGGIAVTLGTASVSGVNFVEQQAASSAPPTGSVAGTVFNARTGAALSGVVVSLDNDRQTTTDAQGRYVFSGLSDGQYRIAQSVPSGLTSAITSQNATVVGGAAAVGPNFADSPAAGLNAAAPQLTGAFRSLPASVLTGSNGMVQLRLSNTGSARARGTIQIDLFASPTSSLVAPQTPIATIPVRVNLASGRSTSVTLRFKYPSAAGTISLIATLDAGNVLGQSNPAAATAVSSPITVAAANATLAATVSAPPTIAAGKSTVLTLTLLNSGNVPARGVASVAWLAATAANDATVVATLVTVQALRLNLAPGHRGVYRLRVKIPAGAVPAGSYFLAARLGVVSGLTDSNVAGLEAFTAARVSLA